MKIIIDNKELEVFEYNNFFNKFKGLMLKKNINNGIRLKNCSSIHTFFMKCNIDIIMTDKKNKILLIEKGLKPWKIIYKKGAYFTYELKEGTINNLKVGNILKTKK